MSVFYGLQQMVNFEETSTRFGKIHFSSGISLVELSCEINGCVGKKIPQKESAIEVV